MAACNASLITFPGFEGIAAAEIKELIGAKATASAAGTVNFEVRELPDLCRLCYLSQSAGSLLLQGEMLNPFDLGLREYGIFGENRGISGNLAYLLLRASGYDGSQFLFDPFTRSGAIAIEAALFGSGFSVNHYRRASLLSHLSQLPQFKGVGSDKFFAVAEKEAAAAAKKRLKGAKTRILSSSQSMQNVRFAEKNARIAGVNKLIRFSRLDIKWLDAKLGEKSVDMVVSYPPQFRAGSGSFAAAANAKLAKMYKEFFCQADFFMKPSGRICLILRKGSCSEAIAASAAYKFRHGVMMQFKVGSREFELAWFGKDLKAFLNGSD